jgi:hypothetical protein
LRQARIELFKGLDGKPDGDTPAADCACRIMEIGNCGSAALVNQNALVNQKKYRLTAFLGGGLAGSAVKLRPAARRFTE